MQLPKCSNMIKHTILVLSKLWERLTFCKLCSSMLLKVGADILRFIAKVYLNLFSRTEMSASFSLHMDLQRRT